MSANQAVHSVKTMARLFNVSRSGYYAWQRRAPSERARQDARLAELIEAAWERSRRTYGMPRIRAELRDMGVVAARKRIARLMRANGWQGVSRRRGWVTTTRRDKRQRPAPDLVQRQFVADAPDRLWIADMTYIPTWTGFVFLAVVVDVFSRRVVGWAMDSSMTAELVTTALDMAHAQRRPAEVIHHSDQGSQYTSTAFGERIKALGVRLSMGSVGDAYDNAMCESFFATLETELLMRCTFRTHTEAKLAVFEFIEGWYNPHRRHSGIEYLSPAAYERRHAERQACAESP